jgi:hypothetical protein
VTREKNGGWQWRDEENLPRGRDSHTSLLPPNNEGGTEKWEKTKFISLISPHQVQEVQGGRGNNKK